MGIVCSHGPGYPSTPRSYCRSPVECLSRLAGQCGVWCGPSTILRQRIGGGPDRVCWCLSVVGRCVTALPLGIPLHHVDTTDPLLNASLGWQVRAGSGVDLLISCVSASVAGQTVCVGV